MAFVSERFRASATFGVVAVVTLVGALPPLLGAILPIGAIFLLFTRLGGADLLGEGLRPKIVELLRTEPGLGITDVCQRLSIGWGTAVHHLSRLEAAGLVVSQDAGRRRRFFLPHETATRRTAVCVLSTDMNRRILELVRDRPGLSQQELCAALGISAPLAHKYISRLIHGDLVTTRRQWRTVQYFAGPQASATLADWVQLEGSKRPEGPTGPA